MHNPLDFLKKIALALAIAFIVPLIIHQGIIALYPKHILTDQESFSAKENEASSLNKSEVLLETYYSHFFTIELIASCLAIVLGLIISLDYLAAGWIMAGVLTIFSSVIFYWRYLSSTLIVISLLIFLSIIIIGSYYTEYKKNKNP